MTLTRFNSYCRQLAALCLSWVCLVSAVSSEEIQLTHASDSILSVEPDFLTMTAPMTPEEIAAQTTESDWQPYNLASSNDFNAQSHLWLRFSVSSQSTVKERLLVVRMVILEHMQVHVFNHKTEQWWHSKPLGLDQARKDRYRASRLHAVPLPLQDDGRNTVYVHVQSTPIFAVPLSLMTESAFGQTNNMELLILGGFLGSLLVMLLYNLSIFTMLRDTSYLYYAIYVLTIIVYQVCMHGFGYAYFNLDGLWVTSEAIYFSASLAFLAASVFVREFLNLRHFGGWPLWLSNTMIALWTGILVLYGLTQAVWLVWVINVSSLLSCAAGVATSLYMARKKIVSAQLFCIAWLAAIIGTIVFILMLNEVLPANYFTVYSQQLGIFVEMVLLSFALAYRINQEKISREQAQQEALVLTRRVSDERRERLRAQEETLSVQKQLNQELESQVQLRTEELEEAKQQLEVANRELTQLSITDPLTGIANRRYFDQCLEDEYKRAHRAGHPLALILLDLDHFKPINDQQGHSVGDKALKAAAEALDAAANRPGDLLARYGGEEFVYVLPDSSLDNALQVAERCRRSIENLDFKADDRPIPMTVSAGVAAWTPGQKDNNYQDLLDAADEALYRAKNAGRNCVMSIDNRPHLVKA